MDAIVFTDTLGRYCEFYAAIDGEVMFSFYGAVFVRCGNVVLQMSKITILVSANILFVDISLALTNTKASNTRTYPAWFKSNFKQNV